MEPVILQRKRKDVCVTVAGYVPHSDPEATLGDGHQRICLANAELAGARRCCARPG
ncbi:MAG: hypothetical protein ACRDGA_08910 [Bacteroidota bacterium]